MLITSPTIANFTNETLASVVRAHARHLWIGLDEFVLIMLRLIAKHDPHCKSRVSLAHKCADELANLNLYIPDWEVYGWLSDFSDEELGITM